MVSMTLRNLTLQSQYTLIILFKNIESLDKIISANESWVSMSLNHGKKKTVVKTSWKCLFKWEVKR